MDDNNQPFNNNLQEFHLHKTINWKKISIIFIILSSLFFILLIIALIIILKNFNSKEKKEDEKWSAKGDKIKTEWGEKLNPKEVWKEYPRPQLQRKEWLNLNGLWNYSITKKNDIRPEKYDGKILVPFPLESSLSGVMKNLTENEVLWYSKEFELRNEWKGNKILLNFGAIDWKSEIYINYKKVGEHEGGFTPFSLDITNYIKYDEKNNLIVKVFDPTDTSYQPVGKQTLKPNGIWYTAVSGIWQTVWIEPVKDHYITNIFINNNFDKKQIKVYFKINSDILLPIKFTLSYKEKVIINGTDSSNKDIIINIPDNYFHPWSPSEPNLYYFKIELYSKTGNLYDSIDSYTLIRKVSSLNDTTGNLRIYLNDKALFNLGTLDQGWWPDGLYTPPSEEAMIFDIKKLKELGFNTIRKHIKVEPARYYYQCDIIGMLVWQDMPSGDIKGSNWDPSKINGGSDKERSDASIKNYYKEWEDIINSLTFFQSIIIWTPFNEAWGQFSTEQVVEFTKDLDSNRLINAASGGNHRICGNFLDLHHYPAPSQFLYEKSLINVLGEYGGLGLEIKGHTWKDENWGYDLLHSKEEVTEKYSQYIDLLIDLVKSGFSAAIYTQTTDVESEINGLITYDRKEIKILEPLIKKKNNELVNILKNENIE
jgi:hypothetical protein